MKSFVKIIRLRNLHLKRINALLNFSRIPDEELKSVQIFRVKNPSLEGREATQTFVKHNYKRAIDKIALYF